MSNVEKIIIEDIEFTVFKRLPVPIAREVQKLFLEMVADYTGEIDDFESGKVKPRDAKNINLDALFEIYDLLLTKAVISPPIKKEDIDNINDDLQICFQELSDLLLEKYTKEKKRVKKKSMNSLN